MLRMLFEKTGNGIWISHLDLMRVFQRAFRRAGLQVRHTQGYNPHAFVSLALPLSVGTASHCELLEFELVERPENLAELPELLNQKLPSGIHCIHAYEAERKLRDLRYLRAQVLLEYDNGIPEGAENALRKLFSAESILVEKKTKSGPAQVDIRPMIHSLDISTLDANTLEMEAVIAAQNPSLNPDLLAKAVAANCPAFAPDFAKSCRIEVYDEAFQVFR